MKLQSNELNLDILTGANDYLSEHAPGLLDNIGPLGSTTTTYFDARRRNSIHGDEVTLAIEVGLSRTYESLCDAKNMSINGHHVNVCILVCINESPWFKNPTSAYDDIANVQTEMDIMGQSVAEPMEPHHTGISAQFSTEDTGGLGR
ncbi:uncharacterized protein V1513DRAFT_428376 [Lipomyces chichibuensis]|uniref:uncharacterized protein n=1 Tax=Lipomyces chichibuensis TaxID=1546026 RepID=UPI0033442DAC